MTRLIAKPISESELRFLKYSFLIIVRDINSSTYSLTLSRYDSSAILLIDVARDLPSGFAFRSNVELVGSFDANIDERFLFFFLTRTLVTLNLHNFYNVNLHKVARNISNPALIEKVKVSTLFL